MGNSDAGAATSAIEELQAILEQADRDEAAGSLIDAERIEAKRLAAERLAPFEQLDRACRQAAVTGADLKKEAGPIAEAFLALAESFRRHGRAEHARRRLEKRYLTSTDGRYSRPVARFWQKLLFGALTGPVELLPLTEAIVGYGRRFGGDVFVGVGPEISMMIGVVATASDDLLHLFLAERQPVSARHESRGRPARRRGQALAFLAEEESIKRELLAMGEKATRDEALIQFLHRHDPSFEKLNADERTREANKLRAAALRTK